MPDRILNPIQEGIPADLRLQPGERLDVRNGHFVVIDRGVEPIIVNNNDFEEVPPGPAIGLEAFAARMRRAAAPPPGMRIRHPDPAGENPVFTTPPKKGEELFRTLLENVKEIYEVDGYVTGGAIRDTLLEVSYRDIDLFLPLTLKQFKAHADELGWALRGSPGKKNYLKGGPTERFLCVSNDTTVDCVFIGDRTEDPVAQFPAHWTRARYTLANGYVTTPEFDADMKAKTCTIIDGLPEEQRDNLVKRFEQWVERTGKKDWSFNIKGLDKNWWQKYNADKALKMKKAKKKTSGIWDIETTGANMFNNIGINRL